MLGIKRGYGAYVLKKGVRLPAVGCTVYEGQKGRTGITIDGNHVVTEGVRGSKGSG